MLGKQVVAMETGVWIDLQHHWLYYNRINLTTATMFQKAEFCHYRCTLFIILCFIVLCRWCIFNKLKFCGNPVLNKFISTIFPTAFVHSFFHFDIFTIFQTVSLLHLLWCFRGCEPHPYKIANLVDKCVCSACFTN